MNMENNNDKCSNNENDKSLNVEIKKTAKQKKIERDLKWKRENKDKVALHNKKHYLKRKERIRKEKIENNQESIDKLNMIITLNGIKYKLVAM